MIERESGDDAVLCLHQLLPDAVLAADRGAELRQQSTRITMNLKTALIYFVLFFILRVKGRGVQTCAD